MEAIELTTGRRNVKPFVRRMIPLLPRATDGAERGGSMNDGDDRPSEPGTAPARRPAGPVDASRRCDSAHRRSPTRWPGAARNSSAAVTSASAAGRPASVQADRGWRAVGADHPEAVRGHGPGRPAQRFLAHRVQQLSQPGQPRHPPRRPARAGGRHRPRHLRQRQRRPRRLIGARGRQLGGSRVPLAVSVQKTFARPWRVPMLPGRLPPCAAGCGSWYMWRPSSGSRRPPSATCSCSATRSRPVVASVTGCST